MRKLSISLLFILFVFKLSSQTYKPNWNSLNTRKMPEWFQQDKFGIFIHWGVYAVPSYAPVIPNSGDSYSEWYWYRIEKKQKNFLSFHNKNFGENFGYQQFEPLFKAEMYEPQQWAEVFKKSGAKYVVLTSKHHEGYPLWNSAESDKHWGKPWNAVTGTPKRDLLGDLTKAVREKGLRMGYYYSLYEWFNPLWLADRKRFVDEHLFPQFKDLVNKYKPSLIFSDGEWDMSDSAWKSPELLAWLFNESPVKNEVVVNDRWGKDTRGKNKSTYTTSEYGAGMNPDVIWEENQGIGHSYGYNRNEKLEDYKSSRDLILILVDVVARGGNLLLDIGPTADGRIPVIMQQRLTDIGKWLETNGEAIFGTRPYKQSYQWSKGELPKKSDKNYMAGYSVASLTDPKRDGAHIEAFFTLKGKDLYAILPLYQNQIVIKNFKASNGAYATVLGSSKKFELKSVGNDTQIDFSSAKPGEIPAELLTIKITGAMTNVAAPTTH